MKNEETQKSKTYAYNIYRFDSSLTDEVIKLLKKHDFKEATLKAEFLQSADYEIRLFFHRHKKEDGVEWVNMLSGFTETELESTQYIYGAAVLYYNKDSLFAISYGNAHFYLNRLCEFNFGIHIAERLINRKTMKALETKNHGSKAGKILTGYTGEAILAFRSSEVPTFLYGDSIDADKWGKTIECGTSARFKWKEQTMELGQKLKGIEDILCETPTDPLPCRIQISGTEWKTKLEELDQKLVEAITNYNDTNNDNLISVPYFYFSGTTIIQNDYCKITLSYRRKKKEYNRELSISLIREFAEEFSLDLKADLTSIMITAEDAYGRFMPKEYVYKCIEFITEDRFCLSEGKWSYFNDTYLERLRGDAKLIPTIQHPINPADPLSKTKNDILKHAEKNSFKDKTGRIQYESAFNDLAAKEMGATLVHPSTTPFDPNEKGYQFEVCDFYTQDTLFFVKIGKSTDLISAAEQARTTLENFKQNNRKLILKTGEIITPSLFRLVMVFKGGKEPIADPSEFKSTNLLSHLINLRTDLLTEKLDLKLDFVYWQDSD